MTSDMCRSMQFSSLWHSTCHVPAVRSESKDSSQCFLCGVLRKVLGSWAEFTYYTRRSIFFDFFILLSSLYTKKILLVNRLPYRTGWGKSTTKSLAAEIGTFYTLRCNEAKKASPFKLPAMHLHFFANCNRWDLRPHECREAKSKARLQQS